MRRKRATQGSCENWKCNAKMTIKKAEQCKINLYIREQKRRGKRNRQLAKMCSANREENPFWNGRESRAKRKKGHEILSIRRDDQNTQQLQVKSFPANVSDFSRQHLPPTVFNLMLLLGICGSQSLTLHSIFLCAVCALPCYRCRCFALPQLFSFSFFFSSTNHFPFCFYLFIAGVQQNASNVDAW